jgi:hypothetical protein
MLQAFEATMKTGDLFADMQVKAALTAYMQNAGLYQRLKQNAAQASGKIEQDLIARRETSKQIWAEVGQAWDGALRRIGDALRPVTDTVGQASVLSAEPWPRWSSKRRWWWRVWPPWAADWWH